MAEFGGLIAEESIRGGWLMWEIALLAIVGFVAAAERTVILGRIRLGAWAGKQRLDALLDHHSLGDLRDALSPINYPVDRVLAAASSYFSGTQAEVAAALELEARREARKLYRRLSLIGLVVVTAPLCGFLGTVTNIMIPWGYDCGPTGLGWVMASISEGLVTTAAGLAVAVPAQLVLTALRSWAEQSEAELEEAVGRVLLHAKVADGELQ